MSALRDVCIGREGMRRANLLMYIWIGFSASCASRKRSWLVIRLAELLSTCV